jgi:hypothetical protein
LVETLNASGARTVYDDTEVGVMFVFLLASLLLNRLRVPLERALTAFQPLFPGFGEIIAHSIGETDPTVQAIIVAIRLLNGSCVLPFLRRARKHDSWVLTHYHPSAPIASDSILETAITLFAPVMNNTEFMLAERPDILGTIDPDLFQRLVSCPAMGHVEIDDCRAPQTLVPFLSNQLIYGMKFRKMRPGRITPQFGFVFDVANAGGPGEAFATFVKVTRQIAEDARIAVPHETWIAEGIRRGVLATWLMYLVVARPVVEDWYDEEGTMRDFFRANYVVAQVYRILHP